MNTKEHGLFLLGVIICFAVAALIVVWCMGLM